MHAFTEGLGPGIVSVMVQSAHTPDLGTMLEVANNFATSDDATRAKSKSLGRPDKKAAHEGTSEVNADFGKGGQSSGGKWRDNKVDKRKMSHIKLNWDKIKNDPYSHHGRFGTPTHTNAQCRLNREIAKEINPGYKGKSNKRKFGKKKKEDGSESRESDTDEAI